MNRKKAQEEIVGSIITVISLIIIDIIIFFLFKKPFI